MKIRSEKIINLLFITSLILIIGLMVVLNLEGDSNEIRPVLLVVSGVIAVLLLLSVVLYQKRIITPLKKISIGTSKLAEGESDSEIIVHTDGMLADVANQMNSVFGNVRSATTFAQEIGEGNFESEVENNDENDALTQALIEMREKLKEVAEEEQKRNWAVQGLATFSELLRNNQNDLEELGYDIIKNLVKYLGANQGGFFSFFPYDGDEELTEDEILFKGRLELVACYAYERRKYREKDLNVGEGLVGQCVVEMETIYLNDVPSNYVNITSGLGKATPKSILIVPLKVNDEIFGVIEIASFKNIEDYQVKFVEDLSESIASTLSSVKMAMHTKTLLDTAEEANKEMSGKEEQMEEIQDELAQKLKQNEEDTAKFQSIVEAVNKTNASIEFDMKGNIIEVNKMFLGVMGYKKDDLVGSPESFLVPAADQESPQHSMMWESLRAGQYFSGEFKRLSKSGKDVWMNGTYSPIFDSKNVPYKIVKFASFTTDEKERELDLNGKLNALKSSVGVLEIDMTGKLRSVNALMLSDLGYKRLETRNKMLSLFVGEEYINGKAYGNLWAGLKDGDAMSQQLTFYTKDGVEKYYKGNFSTIKNLNGIVIKILCILVDVSKEVEQEKALKQELEEALDKSNMISVSDEEKDTKGTMSALNDALEELNNGDLDVKSLLEKNSLPIVMFDKTSNEIKSTTKLMESIVGYTSEEMTNMPVNDLFVFDLDEDREMFFNKTSNSNVFQGDYTLKSKLQGDMNVSLLFAPILGTDEDESLICMITLSM